MPAAITAATGMDALSHLLESFLARDFHPICDAIALHGLQMLKANLSKCYHEPTDLQARGNMMLAALMGAIAFQKGLGVTHSCAHALSAVCNTHHGLANGVMLPSAMAFNAARVPERFVPIASALGVKEGGVIDWLRALQEEIAIPSHLSKIGVSSQHLDALTDFAVRDACHLNNPVAVTHGDFLALFQQAL
jgi:alcohol dehydrogenase class IV